jgi:hypothetical protein
MLRQWNLAELDRSPTDIRWHKLISSADLRWLMWWLIMAHFRCVCVCVGAINCSGGSTFLLDMLRNMWCGRCHCLPVVRRFEYWTCYVGAQPAWIRHKIYFDFEQSQHVKLCL